MWITLRTSFQIHWKMHIKITWGMHLVEYFKTRGARATPPQRMAPSLEGGFLARDLRTGAKKPNTKLCDLGAKKD